MNTSGAPPKTNHDQLTPDLALPPVTQTVQGTKLSTKGCTQLTIDNPGVVGKLTSHLQETVASQRSPGRPRENGSHTLNHLRN